MALAAARAAKVRAMKLVSCMLAVCVGDVVMKARCVVVDGENKKHFQCLLGASLYLSESFVNRALSGDFFPSKDIASLVVALSPEGFKISCHQHSIWRKICVAVGLVGLVAL
jgi:hypothetical protein